MSLAELVTAVGGWGVSPVYIARLATPRATSKLMPASGKSVLARSLRPIVVITQELHVPLSKPIVSLAAALAIALPAAASAAAVVNGDFDVAVPLNGTGGGWTTSGNDGNGGYRTAPTVGVSFSNYFIINAAGQPGSDPLLQQVLTGLEVGRTYRITGEYENAFNQFGDPAALSFGVEIVELALLTELAQPAGDGIGTFAIEFVANASSLTLRLTSERNGDDSSYAVDNIALTAVPEPATLAMLGTAMLGLVASRRRRR